MGLTPRREQRWGLVRKKIILWVGNIFRKFLPKSPYQWLEKIAMFVDHHIVKNHFSGGPHTKQKLFEERNGKNSKRNSSGGSSAPHQQTHNPIDMTMFQQQCMAVPWTWLPWVLGCHGYYIGLLLIPTIFPEPEAPQALRAKRGKFFLTLQNNSNNPPPPNLHSKTQT